MAAASFQGYFKYHGVPGNGFRTSDNFMAIAQLRMSKLRHLPASPFVPAASA